MQPLEMLLSSGSRSCGSIGSTRGCGRGSGDALLSCCLFLSSSSQAASSPVPAHPSAARLTAKSKLECWEGTDLR